MARVVIRPQAAREFAAQARYLARAASGAVARRFQQALADTLVRLAAAPESGSPWESDNPRLAGVRSWPVRRFRKWLIFYRVDEETIEVLHLIHASRDVEGLLDETE